MKHITNEDESRFPPRDEDGRVGADDCTQLTAHIMLPADATREDVRDLMERLYEREPTVLHWSTNWMKP